MAQLSPDFLIRASTKDQNRLFAMLPLKSLTFSALKDRKYASPVIFRCKYVRCRSGEMLYFFAISSKDGPDFSTPDQSTPSSAQTFVTREGLQINKAYMSGSPARFCLLTRQLSCASNSTAF